MVFRYSHNFKIYPVQLYAIIVSFSGRNTYIQLHLTKSKPFYYRQALRTYELFSKPSLASES